MTKFAPLLAALILGAAAPALAQQPQPQPRPQLPNEQRPPAEAHDGGAGTHNSIGRGDTSIGEQHGRPLGDALARPAAPSSPSDQDRSRLQQGDTAATSAKTNIGPGSMGEDKGTQRQPPSTAERPVGKDESHRVDPGGRTPPKTADQPMSNNPPPGSSGTKQ